MTIDEIWEGICKNPEDDDLRLEYANRIEAADADHAWLIREQIRRSREAQAGRYDVPSGREQGLCDWAPDRWASQLLKFSATHQPSDIVFWRGFPAFVHVNPETFIEYADLLFRLAPIRVVQFGLPYVESGYWLDLPKDERPPFPTAKLFTMPQLSRLDGVAFVQHRELPDDLAPGIAACPHLTRCQWIGFAGHAVVPNFIALAQGELTRKMLCIHGSDVEYYGERRQEELDEYDQQYTRTYFAQRGKELEQEYGYIPWLHPSHNETGWQDAVYKVEHGILPKYKPGTPPMPEWYEFPVEYRPRRWWD
ncbi:MAG TPA: hypothetical protein VFQ53_13425 [Kofleriaceae bacterium]|nr:hypothetical protein [Kofleriaceae bacterium]